MRKKNRQIKMTINIPNQYDNEEDFMNDMMIRMDLTGWEVSIGTVDDRIAANVSKITLGDIEITPEEEE